MKILEVSWLDSYGCTSSWSTIAKTPKALLCKSVGYLIQENDEVIQLANSFSKETKATLEQVNGVITIPKCSIVKKRKV